MMDWTDLERLCADRDGWKDCVLDRMRHLDNWGRQLGHSYVWGRDERFLEKKADSVIYLKCRYEGCGKVCKSKGGLSQHQKRVHRAPAARTLDVMQIFNNFFFKVTGFYFRVGYC